MKRRRQPPYEWRYGENDEHRSRNQLDGEPSKTRRKDQRRKYRRRRRRSPTSPSPRQESARLAGVVSEDDEGSVRLQDEKQQRAGSSSSHDDTKGHFRGGQGTEIAGRYRVIRDIGMGTFGRVVECLDLKRARRSTSRRGGENDGPRVAIKIVRDVKRYYDSALIEADIVEDVNRKGGRGTSLCAVMYDAFTWKSHYCLVFECLGPSLYDFLKRHDHQPFPMICVSDFAMQLLEALEFLHSFGLIHTDLSKCR
jgi:Protein kinase domain